MTRLFISGPVSGYPDRNARAFNAAAERLGYNDHDPVSVMDLEPNPDGGWGDRMRQAIGLLLTCQGVATLAGWQESRGASIEVRLAHDLGIPVHPLERWVMRR